MDGNENKKSFEELADEALENVAGGKSVVIHDCVDCICGSGTKQGPDGNWYCESHYNLKFSNG